MDAVRPDVPGSVHVFRRQAVFIYCVLGPPRKIVSHVAQIDICTVRYHIVRSKEQFRVLMIAYINMAYEGLKAEINIEHHEIVKEAEAKEKAHFYKVIGKPMPEE